MRTASLSLPHLRRLARAHRAANLTVLRALLKSKWHEERALALMMLAGRYGKAAEDERRKIFDLYLSHIDDPVTPIEQSDALEIFDRSLMGGLASQAVAMQGQPTTAWEAREGLHDIDGAALAADR